MQPAGAWVALLIPAIWLGIVVALSVKSAWTSLAIPWRSVASVEATPVRQFFPAATIHLHGRSQTLQFRGDISSLVLKTWARVGHASD